MASPQRDQSRHDPDEKRGDGQQQQDPPALASAAKIVEGGSYELAHGVFSLLFLIPAA
jgi:hypothetical protein